MKIGKIFANKGVERNKTPLKNIILIVEISQLKNIASEEEKAKYEKYKFKDLGYLVLKSGFDKSNMCWNGFITPEDLKLKLDEKQWSKFCQGKREFIIQRRVDGKNTKKK